MINLLPYSEKKNGNRVRKVRIVLVALWAVGIGIITLSLLLLPSMTIINTQYELAQQGITQLENDGAVVRPEAISDAQEKARLLRGKFSHDEASLSPSTAITIAQNERISGISFSGFTFEQSEHARLTLRGIVTTREVLQQYVDALQKNDRVTMVDSPISNYLKQKDNEITLVITFK